MTERTCDNCKYNHSFKKCHKCRTYEKNGVVHYHTKFKAKKPEPPSWSEILNQARNILIQSREIEVVSKELRNMLCEERDRYLKEAKMKAKLIINNQEIEIEISDTEYNKLVPKEERKTGYEATTGDELLWCVTTLGDVTNIVPFCDTKDAKCYQVANCYSSEVVAENNARADKLMRQLRRFAVEHREIKFDWNDISQRKYIICFEYINKKIYTTDTCTIRYFGDITFDSRKTAQLAIDTFRDELMWYFTEYKDSL